MKFTFDSAAFTRERVFATSIKPDMRRMIWTSVRVVSFNAERFIKIRMPVDTGRARASWGHSSAPAAPDEGIWLEDEANLSITQGSRVEYIEYLNEGSSTQAPAGFIDAEERRALEDLANRLGMDIEGLWAR